MKIIVKENGELLDYLYNNLDMSHKKIKSYLTHGAIYINNTKVTKYNYPVVKGLKILIDTNQKNKKSLPFEIIYEDSDIIVVNKPSGLLTIATLKEKEKTLYHYISEYLKSSDKRAKVYIVHRLDKDTSGVVLFAKNEKCKNDLQKNWNDIVKSREYVAIVHGVLRKKEDRLVNLISETKTNYVYISKCKGKQAITNYKVERESELYSLLNINIETGRKNQIRVQLSSIGHPIVGDNKYSEKKDNQKRLYLHANKLKLFDKRKNKAVTFTANIPRDFTKLMRG